MWNYKILSVFNKSFSSHSKTKLIYQFATRFLTTSLFAQSFVSLMSRSNFNLPQLLIYLFCLYDFCFYGMAQYLANKILFLQNILKISYIFAASHLQNMQNLQVLDTNCNILFILFKRFFFNKCAVCFLSLLLQKWKYYFLNAKNFWWNNNKTVQFCLNEWFIVSFDDLVLN